MLKGSESIVTIDKLYDSICHLSAMLDKMDR